MKNIEMSSTETGMLFWRLSDAFGKDPLIQMLSPNVRDGLARAFHDLCVKDDKIILRAAEPNIKNVMNHVLAKAPLGWVGDGFREHVVSVTINALLPEGKN